MSKDDKLKLCHGCRDDFYNDHNPLGVKQCWNLKTAKVVKRWRLGWWTQPTVPGAFQEVKTLSCWYCPGQYAHCDKLPAHAVEPRRLSP